MELNALVIIVVVLVMVIMLLTMILLLLGIHKEITNQELALVLILAVQTKDHLFRITTILTQLLMIIVVITLVFTAVLATAVLALVMPQLMIVDIQDFQLLTMTLTRKVEKMVGMIVAPGILLVTNAGLMMVL